jgi:integrase
MKGVILKGERYHYERAWPKKVKAVAPTNKYRMALNLSKGASESEIFQAALIAQEDFEREVALLSNSSVEAISESLVERKTDDAIASLGRMAGELDRRRIQIKTYQGDYPDAIPENAKDFFVRNPMPKKQHFIEGTVWIPEGEAVDPEQLVAAFQQAQSDWDTKDLPAETELDREVKARVKKKLTSRSANRPKTLSSLWPLYCSFRDVEMDNSNSRYRKKLRNYERCLSFIGDHPLVPATDKEINRGLREFVDFQIDKGVKPDSATHAISMFLGMARWSSDEFDLDWNIKAVRVKHDKSRQPRKTASQDQMVVVAEKCIEWNDPIAVIGLLGLHGMIPSEIAKIQSTTSIDAKIPHIIVPPAKTVERNRAVVTAFGVDVLWEFLDEAIEYCRAKTDNEGGSATLNKRLKQLYKDDDKITCYSLRHGCRNAYVRSGASTPIMQAALGWAGGDQGMHLRYGAEGIADSAFLKALDEAARKAHAPIIKALG